MPSYRLRLTVGLLHPGVAPDGLLPEVAGAVAQTATVEAKDVGVVAGRAQITVRFTGADDRDAQLVAARAHLRAEELAQVGGPALTKRVGGRWEPV